MEIEEKYTEVDCTTLSCSVDKDFVQGVLNWMALYSSFIPALKEEDLDKISQDLANVFKARKDLIHDEFYEKLVSSSFGAGDIMTQDQLSFYTNVFYKHHISILSFLSSSFSNLTDAGYITFCKIYEKLKSFIKEEISIIISDQKSKDN
jgi:hypothetical protein